MGGPALRPVPLVLGVARFYAAGGKSNRLLSFLPLFGPAQTKTGSQKTVRHIKTPLYRYNHSVVYSIQYTVLLSNGGTTTAGLRRKNTKTLYFLRGSNVSNKVSYCLFPRTGFDYAKL